MTRRLWGDIIAYSRRRIEKGRWNIFDPIYTNRLEVVAYTFAHLSDGTNSLCVFKNEGSRRTNARKTVVESEHSVCNTVARGQHESIKSRLGWIRRIAVFDVFAGELQTDLTSRRLLGKVSRRGKTNRPTVVRWFDVNVDISLEYLSLLVVVEILLRSASQFAYWIGVIWAALNWGLLSLLTSMRTWYIID